MSSLVETSVVEQQRDVQMAEESSGGWFDLTLDLRSLALCRVVFSIMVLYDLWDRTRHLYLHYGSEGLVRHSLIRVWSFHLSDALMPWLFLFHAVVMVAVGLGWYTRWSTILGWLLLLSLHNRNPFVLYGADGVILLMMLWACFLPWGRVWSLDSKGREAPKDYSLSFKNGGFWLGQVTLIYLITALRKSGPQWIDGTAVYHAMSSFQYFRPLGHQLGLLIAEHPMLGMIATYTALLWEYFVGLAIYTKWRILSVTTIVIFHTSVLLTLDVGMFPVACSIQALSLLPSWVWDKNGKHLGKASSERPIYLAWSIFAVSALFGILSILPNSPVNRRETPYRELESVGLRQTWNMFAPKPPTSHGWYSVKLTLDSGEEVEFFTGEEAPYSSVAPSRPISNSSMRWGIFGFVTYVRRRSRLKPVLADFARRRWLKLHPDRPLRQVQLIYYKADIVPYTVLPYQQKVLYSEDVKG